MHFQDSAVLPSDGFQIELDLMDSHLLYAVGNKILIKLNGLYLGKSKSAYKLGGVFNTFGSESVGRLPANLVKEHIVVPCNQGNDVEPSVVSIKDLDDRMINTLIRIENVEVITEETNLPFAISEEETKRTLLDCDGNKIVLLNSGFSDFYQQILPSGNGSVIGVLFKENKEYQLIIRDTTDLDFMNERCEEGVNEASSEHIFISELADPDNNNKARFAELYNADINPLSLDGWKLNRYTNDNTEIGSSIDLTGQTIEAKSTLVLSPNIGEFKAVYGFDADVSAAGNTAANSNGDDNLVLLDPFGKVIDVFGVIGEDGSGTNHEFEDGRALRNPEIIRGTPIFDPGEWTIYNDTGAMGTVKLPQNAPEDFSPGER